MPLEKDKKNASIRFSLCGLVPNYKINIIPNPKAIYIHSSSMSQREKELMAHIAKLTEDNQEYEKTVNLLKDRFQDFQQRLQLLVEENETLKAALKKREEEKRLNDREINDLRNMLAEAHKDSDEKNRGLTQRVQDLEGRLALQIIELTRLSDLNDRKDAEIADLKQKAENLERETDEYIQRTLQEIEVQFKERLEKERHEHYGQILSEKKDIEKQIQLCKQKIREDENRIALLITDNERLNTLNYEQAQELKSLRERLDNAEKNKAREIEEHRTQLENELGARFNTRIGSYENQIKALTDKVQDFEIRQVLYFIEIERLYHIQNDIMEQFAVTAAENDELKAALDGKSHENNRLEEIIRGLQEQIREDERRIQNLLSENARLSDLSITRLKEIDNLKRALPKELNTEVNPINASNADIKELTLKFESEKRALEQQASQLRSLLDQTKLENIRLKELNDQRKKDYDELLKSIQNGGYNPAKLKELENQNILLQEQYEQAKIELEQMRKTRDLYKKELENQSNRNLEHLNEIVRDTIRHDKGLGQRIGNHVLNDFRATSGGSNSDRRNY